jgi:hypothetical protein
VPALLLAYPRGRHALHRRGFHTGLAAGVTYSVLSATAKLGIAAEESDAVYAVPSFSIPFASGTKYSSVITQLYDRTARGTDTDTQDIQQGPYWSDWTITSQAYPDWLGWLARAMVGPDQFTPGTVTTFAQASPPGAGSVWLATAPPAGSVLQLGNEDTEYAQAGTPSGTGPYLVPVTTPASGLMYAHPAGDAAQSQATHLFEQDRTNLTVWPSYSLTTDDGIDQLGWPGCCLGKVRLQVTPSGYAKLASTWSGFPPVAVSTFAEDQSTAQPFAGWSWAITTAGGVSTRGVSLDLALSRVLQVTPACNGYQGPYFIGPGPMRASGQYKAIYDTAADLNLYREAIQEPAVWTLSQPALQGGASVSVTLSLSGWTQGAVTLEEQFVTAQYKLSGIANTADSPSSGVSSVTLVNFVQAAYGP